MIANGKVYVGTTNSVAAFGLLTTSKPPLPDGDYTLTNASSSMVLADGEASTGSGAPIIQWKATEGREQEWFFSSQGSGYYVIQNIASGLLLTDTDWLYDFSVDSAGAANACVRQLSALGVDRC